MKIFLMDFLSKNRLTLFSNFVLYYILSYSDFLQDIKTLLSYSEKFLYTMFSGMFIYGVLILYCEWIISPEKKNIFLKSVFLKIPEMSTTISLNIFKTTALVFIFSPFFLLNENISVQYIKLSVYILVMGLTFAYTSNNIEDILTRIRSRSRSVMI